MLEVLHAKPWNLIILEKHNKSTGILAKWRNRILEHWRNWRNTLENTQLINNSVQHVGSISVSLSTRCINGYSLQLLQYLEAAVLSTSFGINASTQKGHNQGGFGPLAKVAQIVLLPPTVHRCIQIVPEEFLLSIEWCIPADNNFNSLRTGQLQLHDIPFWRF